MWGGPSKVRNGAKEVTDELNQQSDFKSVRRVERTASHGFIGVLHTCVKAAHHPACALGATVYKQRLFYRLRSVALGAMSGIGSDDLALVYEFSKVVCFEVSALWADAGCHFGTFHFSGEGAVVAEGLCRDEGC